ncbi:MAG: L-erythro-3,5-diaminohexanoate dehydrogenase [Thermodesulfobacteriota bacterium]|nr:L-erythro-3,5-diaminohexanoate dehydrogenase [Thermodesulfobacteriota bacterium]
MMKNGNPYGSHRVLSPPGVLPQPADRIDNNMGTIWDNEIRVRVDTLNVDSASFTQIKEQAGGDDGKIADIILGIVEKAGKLKNPVTGSGGMFIGTVEKIGAALEGKRNIEPGDRIASLVSLSLTPLRIDKIKEIRKEIDQVKIDGQAVLFESGIYAKLPDDVPDTLALAVLDVCGAPAQVERLVNPGDTVAILGASGKSGILCAWEARKRAGSNGRIIGIAGSESGLARLKRVDLCDDTLTFDASDALGCHRVISDLTHGAMADIVINCVNIPNTEMPSILICRDRGTVYFFSMATSFTKAALGAEGVGKDITMIIGNGYASGHAEKALSILRESVAIRKLYEELYT